MSRLRHLGLQALIFATCVLLAIGTVEAKAQSQMVPAKLPEGCSSYASIPLPSDAQIVPAPKIFPACASYRSYRGIGRATNYSEARTCALQERLAQKAGLQQNPQTPMSWVVGGSLILADMYFNGAGVKRDVPLAMRFACESKEGMEDLALQEIEKLHGSAPANKPFEFCDYAYTTFTMNFCAGYESEVVEDRRNRYYTSLKTSMNMDQRRSFEKLLAAQNTYINAHADEVYQGGSIHNIRTLGSQDILNDLFRTDVVHFERKKWPNLTAVQIQAADGVLRREYQKTLERTGAPSEDEIADGVVTAKHVSGVETIWEAYRDAWVAFARLRYPAAASAIRAEITLERYRLLKTIS